MEVARELWGRDRVLRAVCSVSLILWKHPFMRGDSLATLVTPTKTLAPPRCIVRCMSVFAIVKLGCMMYRAWAGLLFLQQRCIFLSSFDVCQNSFSTAGPKTLIGQQHGRFVEAILCGQARSRVRETARGGFAPLFS